MLQKTTSGFPLVSDLNRKLQSYAEQYVRAGLEFAHKLSQAKNFQDFARIQMEFIQAQLQSFGEQTKDFVETYTKAAASASGCPLIRSLDTLRPPVRLRPDSAASRQHSGRVADHRTLGPFAPLRDRRAAGRSFDRRCARLRLVVDVDRPVVDGGIVSVGGRDLRHVEGSLVDRNERRPLNVLLSEPLSYSLMLLLLASLCAYFVRPGWLRGSIAIVICLNLLILARPASVSFAAVIAAVLFFIGPARVLASRADERAAGASRSSAG